MKSAKTTNDADEIAVLTRAKRNFHNNGLGDRMWADPGSADDSTLSKAFFLNEDQRSAFIADARAEIKLESSSSHQSDASAYLLRGKL